MISAETRYKIYDSELVAIVEAFKTWRHYLKGYNHEVLVLTDHNNLRRFMNTKSLSSRQVRWIQKLSRYHFQINYCEDKVNGAADALSRYPQQNAEEEETLWAENVKNLHRLQSSLTNTILSSLSTLVKLSSFHQVLICRTYVLPQLWQFWDNIRSELVNKGSYTVSIGRMRLWLAELQELDEEAQRIRAEGLNGYKELDGVLYQQRLPFVPKTIWTIIISRHHDDHLIGHFGINETKDLVGRKYYKPSLWRDIEAYVKGCNVCLGSKAVRHKLYGDLQSLPVPTHWWKNLLIDFITRLPISTDWKDESFDSILVIVNRLTKMMHYELVKVTINAPRRAKVILDVVVSRHGLFESIVSDKGSLFTSKFWSSLCYFLGIKRRLSTIFHLQIDNQTKRQNSTIQAYL